MMREYEIEVETKSETNQRCHWAVKAKRAKEQRRIGRVWSEQWTGECAGMNGTWGECLPPKPWRITLTRIGRRRLDTGNVPAAMKAVQDGICDALQIDDGDEAHEWCYKQQTRKPSEGACGVGVKIETIGGK